MTYTRRSFALTCGASALAQAPREFRAGAAAVDITPPLGVLLDGTIMENGPARHIHDELRARCLVLDDGSCRLAIVVIDCTMISREVLDQAKQIVHKHTGLRPDRMLMSATHSHSAVRAIGVGTGELDREYYAFLIRRIADSVRVAHNNLAPARIGWGAGSKPELVFNRRWFMKPGTVPPDPFGGRTDRVQMNPVDGRVNLVKPAGPVDPEVAVISVQHADGRPLAVLANFGFHYAGGYGAGDVSADYFGLFGTRLARLLKLGESYPPFVGLMSNGACGDVTGADFSRPPVKRAPYVRMGEVADALAEEAYRVMQRIEHRAWVPLAMLESELEVGVRRPSAERLAWARAIWEKAASKTRHSRPEIYAREAIFLSQYPPSLRLKLQALRIGELGIAAAPCEVFSETGLAVKRQSPLRPTFLIELANGYSGYLPTPQQHEWGGYETWPARSSCLEVEGETKIRTELGRLLVEVSNSAG
ncbi:MAG: neutral/alkaline non-lysosomal ceramidase N-terminal domain-containing protein [Bryobacteraceae bacterium]